MGKQDKGEKKRLETTQEMLEMLERHMNELSVKDGNAAKASAPDEAEDEDDQGQESKVRMRIE